MKQMTKEDRQALHSLDIQDMLKGFGKIIYFLIVIGSLALGIFNYWHTKTIAATINDFYEFHSSLSATIEPDGYLKDNKKPTQHSLSISDSYYQKMFKGNK